MAKLTMGDGEGPSDTLIADARKEAKVTDSRGRVITLRKPPVLAQFKLVKLLGDNAKNGVYVGMVLPLLFITAIDDEPVYFPASELEIDALINRLDEDGVAEVMNGVEANFGATDREAVASDLKKP